MIFNNFGGNTMNYLEMIIEILQRASVVELERVYNFLKAYIKGQKKE